MSLPPFAELLRARTSEGAEGEFLTLCTKLNAFKNKNRWHFFPIPLVRALAVPFTAFLNTESRAAETFELCLQEQGCVTGEKRSTLCSSRAATSCSQKKKNNARGIL